MRLTVLLTVVAMIAVAGNSLLMRAAVAGGAIDAASFTAIRMGSAISARPIAAR